MYCINDCAMEMIVSRHPFIKKIVSTTIDKYRNRISADANGTVVLCSEQNSEQLSAEEIKAQYFDRTGYEVFRNEVVLDQIIFKLFLSWRPIAVVIAMVKIKDILKIKMPEKAFKIIGIIEGQNLSVRFHTIREGETWLCSNIDQYTEGVFVIDTSCVYP